MKQRIYQVKRARREWECSSTYVHGRARDGGPLPPCHTGRIRPGEQYVQWQQHGETKRMCERCARSAGLPT